VTDTPDKPDKPDRSKPAPLQLAPELRRTLDEVARDYSEVVLQVCRGNRTNAARVLGIDRKTLASNLRRWGIGELAEDHELRPGSLIAFEGLDGAGLTTQAKLLVGTLEAHGHPAMYTAEPSDGSIGQLIERMLAAEDTLDHAGAMRVLSLLFAADRIDHFERTVAPALARGVTVVTDRWYHSSLAYQRTAVAREWIMALNRHTRTPDVTIVLQVDPETGRMRRAAAGRAAEFFHDSEAQRDAVAGYRATILELRADGERIEVIDGEPAPAEVAQAVLRTLGVALKLP
jgi:dTMP kinase